MPTYRFLNTETGEEFEGELGVLCHRYGLNVDFDYIVED